MPIYMDRHNTETATSEDLAKAHILDLEVQNRFDVRFLTYWFDQARGVTFCLVEAPDTESVAHVHELAHGNVQTEIIEVDLNLVRAFLGRTEDPPPNLTTVGDDGHPPIDSAFRTIMFTDMQDSTGLSTYVGDARALELLDKHDHIIRSALESHGGSEVKHTGDGFLASFVSVTDCLESAMSMQRAFDEFNRREADVPLRIRIGINAGEPVERGGDLFGMVVQLASRICDHAIPDQILVAGVIPRLCADAGNELAFKDAGQVPLKGFVSAVQLYELGWQPA